MGVCPNFSVLIPCSAKVEECVELYLHSPICPYGVVLGAQGKLYLYLTHVVVVVPFLRHSAFLVTPSLIGAYFPQSRSVLKNVTFLIPTFRTRLDTLDVMIYIKPTFRTRTLDTLVVTIYKNVYRCKQRGTLQQYFVVFLGISKRRPHITTVHNCLVISSLYAFCS